MKPRARKEEDSAWKHILETHFREFLAFYFPDLYRKIDRSQKAMSLDKELQRILPRSRQGNLIVDRLCKVRLRTGREAWILVHVEVQGRKTRDFAQRIHVCRYRIFDRYRQRVVSLAVYTGKGKAPQGLYRERRLGDELTLRFPVATTEAFRGRWKELERSRNPFAAVTMAHLAMGSARTARERLRWKERLAERLFEQGYPEDDIIALYRFLDWLVVLPPELEQEYEVHVDELERRQTMPFLSTRDKRAIRKGRLEGRKQGIEQGREQGVEEGLVEAIERGLALRFGDEGRRRLPRVRELHGVPQLRRVLESLFSAESIEELCRRHPELALPPAPR